MKLLAILIFGFLVIQTLGQKNPSKRSGPPPKPQGPPPRRPHRPPPGPPKNQDDKKKGVGWGSNLPPTYQTTSCVDPATIVLSDYDADFFNRARLYYVTGDTKYNYIMNARILLGHHPSQDELNQMCLTQECAFNAPQQIVSGFGVQFEQSCMPTEFGVWECPVVTDPSSYDGNLGVNVNAGFVSQTYYLLATDNETYVINYICNDGLYGTFTLSTLRPYASPEAVALYVQMAKKYGFRLDQLQLLQCNSAHQGPYPHPFENYPKVWSSGNGWSNNSTGWGAGPSNGWNQILPSNGWNSNPQQSGWNSQPNGWSNNHNNGRLSNKQAKGNEKSHRATESKYKMN